MHYHSRWLAHRGADDDEQQENQRTELERKPSERLLCAVPKCRRYGKVGGMCLTHKAEGEEQEEAIRVQGGQESATYFSSLETSSITQSPSMARSGPSEKQKAGRYSRHHLATLHHAPPHYYGDYAYEEEAPPPSLAVRYPPPPSSSYAATFGPSPSSATSHRLDAQKKKREEGTGRPVARRTPSGIVNHREDMLRSRDFLDSSLPPPGPSSALDEISDIPSRYIMGGRGGQRYWRPAAAGKKAKEVISGPAFLPGTSPSPSAADSPPFTPYVVSRRAAAWSSRSSHSTSGGTDRYYSLDEERRVHTEPQNYRSVKPPSPVPQSSFAYLDATGLQPPARINQNEAEWASKSSHRWLPLRDEEGIMSADELYYAPTMEEEDVYGRRRLGSDRSWDEGRMGSRGLATGGSETDYDKHGRRRKPTKWPRRPLCAVEGCYNISKTRGLCKRHGGGERCRYPGCKNSAKKGGRCIRHGGGQCRIEGCITGARPGGLCAFHAREERERKEEEEKKKKEETPAFITGGEETRDEEDRVEEEEQEAKKNEPYKSDDLEEERGTASSRRSSDSSVTSASTGNSSSEEKEEEVIKTQES